MSTVLRTPVAPRNALSWDAGEAAYFSISEAAELLGVSRVTIWRWISATEVHYRPKVYWKANSKVFYAVNLKGVKLGEEDTLDHKCRCKRCIHPDHTKVMSREENTQHMQQFWRTHRAHVAGQQEILG